MRIDAVAVSSTNVQKTIAFYELLGFEFPELQPDDQHIESINTDQTVRLMIDSSELMYELNNEEPRPGNHSSFAVLYDSSNEVNSIADKIAKADFTVVKEPWDAFWGQRYCVVQDPDGYSIDLFATLN